MADKFFLKITSDHYLLIRGTDRLIIRELGQPLDRKVSLSIITKARETVSVITKGQAEVKI